MPRILKWIFLLALLALAAMAIRRYSRPEPLLVDTARTTTGPLEVAVEEQGETREHDRFLVTAPIAGRITRIELHEGDPVRPGQVLAWLHPAQLDVRGAEEARAHVRQAEALVSEAQQRIEQAQANLELARKERNRMENLSRTGDVPQRSVDQARTAETGAAKELAAAQFRAKATEQELEGARAALIGASGATPVQPVPVRSPVQGRVHQIVEKSERNIVAGAPLISIGDARQLELIVDVLTTDAIRIRPGQPAWIENWGGPRKLAARVRQIEPQGFTKVSALGIEEKRVHVVLDLEERPAELGDGYRVEARIIVWSREKALQAPSSAVFREADGAHVFVVENGLAHQRKIETGERSTLAVEVLSGVNEGDLLILHPPRELADGTAVTPPPTR